MPGKIRENSFRSLIFLFAALIHVLIIIFVVFPATGIIKTERTIETTIRLTNIEEERPIPVLPPEPPQEPPAASNPPPAYAVHEEQLFNAIEAVAENMIEADEVPDDTIVDTQIISGTTNPEGRVGGTGTGTNEEEIVYLPMGRITKEPEFPTTVIARAVVYPQIALRAGIEGRAVLEIFIDQQGNIRNIILLGETPEGHGFGEAALNAMRNVQDRGIQVKPAESDGRKVAVRYRYPIRFTPRN